MKIFKTAFFILMVSVLFLLSERIAQDRQEALRLTKTYGDSEQTVRLLHSEKFFRLYKEIRKREPLVSPVDLTVALNDFSALNLKVDDLDRLASFAKVRHLLSSFYPADFAEMLVRFEKSFPAGKELTTDFPAWNEETLKDNPVMAQMLPFSLSAYLPPERIKNERYAVIGHEEQTDGFAATAFKDEQNRIIIAYRGSDEKKDLEDTLNIVNGELPEQFQAALTFYKELRKKNPKAKILATGHSLGGSLAQLVAAFDAKVSAYACAPVGTKNLIEKSKELSDHNNIFNLVTEGDSIPLSLPQPGKTFLLKSTKTDKYGDALHPHSVLNCLVP